MCLASLTAVYVAQPLLPSEGAAASGDGLPFAMLLLATSAAWLLLRLSDPGRRFRRGSVDAAWLLLILLVGASAVWSGGQPTTRASINTFWQWTALGLGFWLWRQLLWTERERRACVAVMLGLAVAIAGLGLHQYLVTMPQTREAYRQNPDQSLRAAGIAAPPGSPERLRFENRLASTEPTATFALANSLAGFLTCWFVVAFGVALARRPTSIAEFRSRGAPPAWLAAALIALPLAFCLVLTKSRSAYGACGLGLLATAWLVRGGGRRSMAWILGGAAAIAGGLFAVARLWGAIDRELVTEAFKSLTYRWQYWQASLAIVRDHPWLGCGPGNFQDFYTRYKLVEASEVVADPHSLVFEVWSTAGTPALIALLAVLACCLPKAARPADADRIADPLPEASDASAFVLAGGVAGFVLALLVGHISAVPLSVGACAGGMAALLGVWWLMRSWVYLGDLPPALPGFAAAAMAINLLAAGGIGFGGVAGSFWLLLALALSRRSFEPAPATWPVATGLACVLSLALACWLTAYGPVMACSAALLEAQMPGSRSESRLLAAADADPWSDEPWRQLAQREFAQWRMQPTEQGLQQWDRYMSQVHDRRPNSSAAWRYAGDSWLEAWSRTGDRRDLDRAVAAYEMAVKLYPNHATGHALLALALRRAGESSRAADETRQAISLDRRNPHADQKLPPTVLRELQNEAKD